MIIKIYLYLLFEVGLLVKKKKIKIKSVAALSVVCVCKTCLD